MKDSTFGIYFDLFCAFATPCQHNNSVASNFLIKKPTEGGENVSGNGILQPNACEN
jgi:hypothetical protein